MTVHAYPFAQRLALSVCAVSFGLNGAAYLARPPSVSSTVAMLLPVLSALLVTIAHQLLAMHARESDRRVALSDAQVAVHEGQADLNRALAARMRTGEGELTVGLDSGATP